MEDLRRALTSTAAPAEQTWGLGLYLRARVEASETASEASEEASEEADEAAFEALDRVLDAARDGLPGCGLALVVEGADFLLAATPLPAGEEASRERRQQGVEALGALWPVLERQVAGAGVLLEAVLHVAEAVVEPGPGGGLRVVDGALLRQGEWTAGAGRAGVFATRGVLEGLTPAPATRSVPGHPGLLELRA
jgi:hypothetical protein